MYSPADWLVLLLSYSLEGLSEVSDDGKGPSALGAITQEARLRGVVCHQGSNEERVRSLESLTEEHQSELGVRTTEHGQVGHYGSATQPPPNIQIVVLLWGGREPSG
jgi:hypothetical protein